MSDSILGGDPEHLAAFVQEYVRRENQPDAGVLAVIAAQLRDPQWLPHQIAERLLAQDIIQAAIKAARGFYRPPDSKEVSADTVSMDMENVFQEAMSARQFTAAIAAKKLQAEIVGLLAKTLNVNVHHTVGTMADSELEAIARRGVIDGEFQDITGLPAVVSAAK